MRKLPVTCCIRHVVRCHIVLGVIATSSAALADTIFLDEPAGATRTDTLAQAGIGFYASTSGTEQINRLGFWDEGGDGLQVAHDVALYNFNADPNPGAVFTLIAKATVPAGTAAPLEDGYRWVDIPTLTLSDVRQAGDFYVLTATQGTDEWTPPSSGTLSVQTPAIGTIVEGIYSATAMPATIGQTFTGWNQSGAATQYGGPNIGFVSTPAPEPGSFILLLVGTTGLWLSRRTRLRS